MYCKIAMFSRDANFLLEENGEYTELKEKISVKELGEKLPALMKQYGVTKVRLVGNHQFAKGIAEKIKKANLEFSNLEIEVV